MWSTSSRKETVTQQETYGKRAPPWVSASCSSLLRVSRRCRWTCWRGRWRSNPSHSSTASPRRRWRKKGAARSPSRRRRCCKQNSYHVRGLAKFLLGWIERRGGSFPSLPPMQCISPNALGAPLECWSPRFCPLFVYVQNLSNLYPIFVHISSFFCPCPRFVQTLPSKSNFCPLQIQILS